MRACHSQPENHEAICSVAVELLAQHCRSGYESAYQVAQKGSDAFSAILSPAAASSRCKAVARPPSELRCPAAVARPRLLYSRDRLECHHRFPSRSAWRVDVGRPLPYAGRPRSGSPAHCSPGSSDELFRAPRLANRFGRAGGCYWQHAPLVSKKVVHTHNHEKRYPHPPR